VHKGEDLWVVGEVFFYVLNIAQEVGVAILKVAGGFVIDRIAVHHQHPGGWVGSQDLLGDLGTARLAKSKEAELRGAKQPGIPVLTIRAPSGLIGMFDWRYTVVLQKSLLY
jgi:hypothetical protein